MTSPSNPPRPKQPAAANYSTSTSSGVEPNVAAALSYILGLLTGVLFLVLEKQNQFIRFHAAQSIVVSAILLVVTVGVSMISGLLVFVPFLGRLAVFLILTGLTLATFVLWLALMWRAYQGDEWEVPVAGGVARKMI